MKNQTIVSMSPVFDAEKPEIKHYSTVVGTRSESGEYRVEDCGEVKTDELEGFVKGYRGSKFVGVMANKDMFTRYIKLPAATPENFLRMVGFEAQQNVPYKMEETLWGYRRFPKKEENGDEEIRMIALKSDLAEQNFPFKLDMLTDSVDGIVRLYQNRIKQSNKLIAIVNCDEKSTNVIFADSDFGRFSRSIALSIFRPREPRFDDMPEEEYKKNYAMGVYADIARTIIFARTQQGLAQPELWTTSKSVEKQFDVLGKEMKLIYKSPFEELRMGKMGLSRPLSLDEEGITPTYALAGLVSWPDGINILPVRYTLSESFRVGLGSAIVRIGKKIASAGVRIEGFGRDISRRY